MTVREIASRIQPGPANPVSDPGAPTGPDRAQNAGFAQQLRRAGERASDLPPFLKLSTHALERIEQRGISMTASDQQSLTDAMLQLAEKGARDALLMRSDAAFIVNVPSRTVVTAMNSDELRERVFTQIDSALLL